MAATVRRATVMVLLVFFAACERTGPGLTSPSATTSPSPPPSPTPPPLINFPPRSGPARTFVFDRDLSYPVRDGTRNSRFVIYDNGAFELQYPPNQYGSGLFRGAYQDENGILMFLFEFQGRTVGTPWDDATGSFKGDSLTVKYDPQMQQADFEDAIYVRMP